MTGWESPIYPKGPGALFVIAEFILVNDPTILNGSSMFRMVVSSQWMIIFHQSEWKYQYIYILNLVCPTDEAILYEQNIALNKQVTDIVSQKNGMTD